MKTTPIYPIGFADGLTSAREVARTINAYTLWFRKKYLKGSSDPMPALKTIPGSSTST